jgi:protein O-mannosyl-transferase
MRQSSEIRNDRRSGATGAEPPDTSWRRTSIVAAAIVVAVLSAYGNTLKVPFIFDDTSAIHYNPSVKSIWPPWSALLSPHTGSPVEGRPFLNFSFAVNYAVDGLKPRGYHIANLTIHILAALLLYAVVRRTLVGTSRLAADGTSATILAAIVALIWAVHPLQTESVTYISQRAESLVSLFYLLTLYCAIRGADSNRSAAWSSAAVLSCTLGMASKEVMVSAPLIVLLYDRTFLSGSFHAAIHNRRGMYAGLAATWLLLAALVIDSAGRGGSAGFGTGVSPWAYALTQCKAIPHYLRLCFWPTGLCFDYGDALVRSLGDVWPQAIGLVVLVVLTVVALWRRPAVGFLGAAFFAVLAPSSSIVPVATQPMAEHRMYLPLAAVTTAAVLCVYLVGRRLIRNNMLLPSAAKAIGLSLAASVVVLFGILTFLRNIDYRSEISIYTDTVAKTPNDARVRHNFGHALAHNNQVDEAIYNYNKALEINPGLAEPHFNLGIVLGDRGQISEAIEHYRKALELKPDYTDVQDKLKLALSLQERTQKDLAERREQLRAQPKDVFLLNDTAWFLATHPDAAVRNAREAIELAQRAAELSGGREPAVLDTLAAAYAASGRFNDAVQTAKKALDLASQQNNQPLVESIEAKIRLYEANTPFRESQAAAPSN